MMLVGVLVAQLLELVEEPTLLVGETARDGDVHEHAMVAVAEALEHGHPLAAEDADVAGLGARVELELLGAFERVDRHLRPERGLHDREVDLGEDVVPLADESLVRPDVDVDVGVAVAAAEARRRGPGP